MRKETRHTTTVTVRLTDEEYEVLRRLCVLKQTSQTGYLTHLATSQARKELLDYAVEEYRAGKASLSELAKKTGLDVPTIMEEVAKVTGEDKRIVEGFLSAVKTLSEANEDPEFYSLALKAIG
jgi:UDP-glucose 6-dehydrogenase